MNFMETMVTERNGAVYLEGDGGVTLRAKERTKWCFVALISENGDLRSETGGFTGRNNRFRTSDLLRRESVESIC